MDALVIDAFEFCRLNERREGEIAVAELPRLADETLDRAGSLRWSLMGGSGRNGLPQLHIFVAGDVRLSCQRCLTPFSFAIASESTLVLAKDEVSADEIDALLADEEVEVIVGSKALDIRQVIEDDALLALPLAPKHLQCPDQVIAPVAVEAKKPSPFAVLKDLKK